jgi:pimeloyl-ACP methyl ester carboxylesterase
MTLRLSQALAVAPPSWTSTHRFQPSQFTNLLPLPKLIPGKVNMASGGVGNVTHMQGELFKSMAGVNMQHLPYRGEALALVSSAPGDFASLEEAESYLRDVLAPFGDLLDEHWAHLTCHSVSWHEDRRHFVMLCDREIVRAFRNPWQYSLDLWEYWTAIKLPMLVIRGAESDLLPRPRAEHGAPQRVRQDP